MKPAHLRPQARRDQEDEIRYHLDKGGSRVAAKLVAASEEALDQIERQPGMGSPLLGHWLDIPKLRTWRVTGFPLMWCCLERSDHLDVIRLLGERQDIAAQLFDRGPDSVHEPTAAYAVPDIP